MNKLYTRIVWENFPSERTALNESNLNRMDLALDNIDNRVIEMDSTKVNVETANNLIKNWTMDEETGVITVEKLNGEKIIFDLNIEKIPVNFELSDNGILTMTTDDGTQYTANIGAMIPVLTFEDSDEIAVSVTGTGVNKTYSFSIKAGSVTEDKLQPNFLADVKTEVAKAQASKSAAEQSASDASSSATLAESYTHGGTGAREGEETDNAKYYMEQAKAVSAVDIATTEKAGIVKPDGTTITADEDGTLHGVAEVTVDTALSSTSTNPVQNKVVTSNLIDLKKEITINLLNPTLQTTTNNGVTCTNNGDGTYTLNGTASDWANFYLPEIYFENGKKYKMIGCVGGSADTYYLSYSKSPWYICVNKNGVIIEGTGEEVQILITCKPNSVLNNIVFKPMLTTNLSATYDDFVPYTGDTGRLNGDVAELNKTVDTLKKSVSDGKTLVATAITDKGVETAADATFAVMAENIGQIETGGGELHGATISVATTEETLIGKTITLSLNDTVVATRTFDDNGACSFTDIQEAGTYSLYSTDGADSATIPVDVTAENIVNKTVISCEFYLTPDGETITPVDDVAILLKCAEIKDKSYTTMDELLADEQAMGDITMSENAMQYLARSTGFADEVCANENFMTYLGQSAYVDSTVLNSDLWVDAVKNSPYKWLVLECPVYPFSTASDADLAKMLDAYYNGDITIDDIKTKNSVGDTRSVSLSAMSATGVGESHRAQTVQFAIGDFEHDDLTSQINGHTKAAMTLTQVHCLMDAANESNPVNGSSNTENGYMNSTNTNVGGWASCARRTWCNDVYYNALPSGLKSLVKAVNKLTSAGNQSATINTTSDKVFLLSEIEIFGNATYSFSGEGVQYTYYKNVTANRCKNPKWTSSNASSVYWERSPRNAYADYFCGVSTDGTAGANYDASRGNGLAPCLCI